ncbi:hypothetical protein [Novosphingobium sp. Rr 2-17]|uniref:hypothetical protein n=1 Tax=Novosphingobium sp. Rr 2-17 TaxID=555793 RepID=UPI00178C64BC|nr:hypothetical protein [Novosphingobium sp. Rr 2-17]
MDREILALLITTNPHRSKAHHIDARSTTAFAGHPARRVTPKLIHRAAQTDRVSSATIPESRVLSHGY